MKKIATAEAPAAIGPYSQALESQGFIFVSGQIPVDPQTGTMPEGIEKQTARSLENVKAILEAGGSGMDKVLKTTVLLKDMGDFAMMNEVYASFFPGEFPVRACYQVAALPKDALVEIEAIAEK